MYINEINKCKNISFISNDNKNITCVWPQVLDLNINQYDEKCHHFLFHKIFFAQYFLGENIKISAPSPYLNIILIKNIIITFIFMVNIIKTRQSDAPAPCSQVTVLITSMKDCLRNTIVSGRHERCPRIFIKQQILTKNQK